MQKFIVKNYSKLRNFSKTQQKLVNLNEIPLTSFFPSTPDRNPQDFPTDIKYETTVLPNGVTVKSSEYHPSGTTSLSFSVEAGSRYETYDNYGVSHFIQRFFFDNTMKRSKLRLVREMEKTGANVSASSGREDILYKAEGLRHSMPKLFDLMTDSILYGRLHDFDLPPKTDLVEQDMDQFEQVPEFALNEALHRAAFNEKGLGNSLICPAHQLHTVNTDTIKNYMDKFYQPNRITVTATNFNHEDLVDLTTQLYSHLENTQQIVKEPTKYTGGNIRIHKHITYSGESETHAVLGYNGVARDSKDAFALQVLANIVGDFDKDLTLDVNSKGKGSHLMQRINSPYLSKAKAFNVNYSDAGLFGVYIAGPSACVSKGLRVAKELLVEISQKGVSDKSLNRGKNKSIFGFNSALETNAGLHEFVLNNKNTDVLSYIENFNKVSKEDVARVAQLVLKSQPTLVSYGNLEKIPTTFDL